MQSIDLLATEHLCLTRRHQLQSGMEWRNLEEPKQGVNLNKFKGNKRRLSCFGPHKLIFFQEISKRGDQENIDLNKLTIKDCKA